MDLGIKGSFDATPRRQPAKSNQRFSSAAELFEEPKHMSRSNYLTPIRTSTWNSTPTINSPTTPRQSINEKDCLEVIQPQDTVEGAQRQFLGVITDDSNAVENAYFAWYCKFLEAKFQAINSLHLRICVSSTWFTESVDNAQLNLRLVYFLLALIANIVSSDSHISLFSIVDRLVAKSIFVSGDKSTSEMNQLVFMTLGWLSMLYSPSTKPVYSKLQIKDEIEVGRARVPRSRAVGQDFTTAHQPIRHLLRMFGDITPLVISRQHKVQEVIHNREQLIHSYLSYHTLKRVCGINIEWVDSLNAHLTLVESRRVLKIFRFPSFCYLHYQSTRDDLLLAHLFAGTSSSFDERSDQASDIREYLREVLLSYRLIFSQDRSSWKAFNAHHRKSSQPVQTTNAAEHDPLLYRICGRSWRTEREPYYKTLEADETPRTIYAVDQDFPYLGSKLLKLQHFSADQHPHNLKKLFWDRRDIRQFYTFWAVLWIGGGTILLGIIQIIIAGLQLAASNEQNRLQAAQLAAMAPLNGIQ